MNLKTGIIVGLKEMASHRMRTALTMLGVIFGVATFITLFSVLEGSMDQSRAHLREEGGLEKVTIYEMGLGKKDRLALRQNRSRGRTLGDYKAMKAMLDLTDDVSPEVAGKGPLKYAGKESYLNIRGVTAAVLDMDHYEVVRGRFICDLDQLNYRSVCVLGSKAVEELFGNVDPMGKTVTIEGRPMLVVGILKKHALMYGKWNAFEYKNQVCFVPFASFLARSRGNDHLDGLDFRVIHTDRLAWAVDQARNLLLWRHGVEDFNIQTHQDWAENERKGEVMASIMLGIIAGICLLSGGIGIMNIMLATVRERTREIGVRRAIGARRRDIMAQFLLETLAFGTVGGAIGVIAGIGLAKLLTLLPETAAIVKFWPVAMAFVSAVIICLCFGLYPAWRASRLDPIEALRND